MIQKSVSLTDVKKRFEWIKKLTLTRPIGLPPYALVAQKITDQRWLIVNSAKIGILFI